MMKKKKRFSLLNKEVLMILFFISISILSYGQSSRRYKTAIFGAGIDANTIYKLKTARHEYKTHKIKGRL
jgi:hypothetical protein